jgi:hypothetical protein
MGSSLQVKAVARDIRQTWHWFVVCALLLLAGCAIGQPALQAHSFGFDARRESPDVEILNYRYGNSKNPMARPADYQLQEGKVSQFTNTYGEMLRGDSLYVQWRIKSTGQVYEDTVDLKSRLPADITDHTIHFIVDKTQLYVYLISPEKLNPNPCPMEREERVRLSHSELPGERIFSMYCVLKIITLYPDPPKK